MKIQLGNKAYSSKELTFGDLYKSNEFIKYFNDGASKGENMQEEFDKIANYLVDIFGGQFTVQDVYEKLPSKGCIPKVMNMAAEIRAESMGELGSKNEAAVVVEN